MTDYRDIRTTFILHPPVDDAASWHMTVDGFVQAFTRLFPDAFTKFRTSHLRGNDVVDFEVEVGPGIWIEGTAQTPVPECGVITLALASATEAARFATWVRDDLIPSPGILRFSTEPAMQAGSQDEWTVPAAGDEEAMTVVFLEHLAAFG